MVLFIDSKKIKIVEIYNWILIIYERLRVQKGKIMSIINIIKEKIFCMYISLILLSNYKCLYMQLNKL